MVSPKGDEYAFIAILAKEKNTPSIGAESHYYATRMSGIAGQSLPARTNSPNNPFKLPHEHAIMALAGPLKRLLN